MKKTQNIEDKIVRIKRESRNIRKMISNNTVGSSYNNHVLNIL